MKNSTAFASVLVASLAVSTALDVSIARADDTAAAASGPTHRRRHASPTPSAVVSFPGFRLNADGTSRCFVHVTGSVVPETHASARRFEVRLPGAHVEARNHLNPLETRFFNTPMLRARLERRRHDLVLVVDLRAEVTATMHTEADPSGATLVVVELPAGSYVTEPPRIREGWEMDESPGVRASDGSGSVRPSEGTWDAEERPSREAELRSEGTSTTTGTRTTTTTGTGTSTATSAPAPTPTMASPAPTTTTTSSGSRTTGHDTERPPIFGN